MGGKGGEGRRRKRRGPRRGKGGLGFLPPSSAKTGGEEMKSEGRGEKKRGWRGCL